MNIPFALAPSQRYDALIARAANALLDLLAVELTVSGLVTENWDAFSDVAQRFALSEEDQDELRAGVQVLACSERIEIAGDSLRSTRKNAPEKTIRDAWDTCRQTLLAEIPGLSTTVLSVERSLLNLPRRLSGVSEPPTSQILETRQAGALDTGAPLTT